MLTKSHPISIKKFCFRLVSILGAPLFMDVATLAASRPSVARVCIEIDLLKPRPLRSWIGNGNHQGLCQNLILENLPKFCSHCFRQGHEEGGCHILNPDLHVSKVEGRKLSVKNPRLEFEPKRLVCMQVFLVLK